VFLALDVEHRHLQFERDQPLVGGDERGVVLRAAVGTRPRPHVYLDVVEVGIEHLAGLRDGDPHRFVGGLHVVDGNRGLHHNSAIHV